MLDFIRKSPLGFILTAAAVILALSPEAREGARKMAVKGTGAILDVVEKARNSSCAEQATLIGDNPGFPDISETGSLAENKKTPS